MFGTGLTAYWISTSHGPLGLGVTAWSVEDALRIVQQLGYGMWLPADPRQAQLNSDVTIETLDPYVRRHMGPVVVRGLWYPFTCVGVPRWADA